MPTYKPYQKVSLRLVLVLYASTILMSAVYWFVGTQFFDSPLFYKEFLIFTAVLAIAIVGSYQLFFWVEYNNTSFPLRNFHTALDDKIPFIPSFIWIYSFSYYAAIGLVASTIPSLAVGVEYIFGGLILLTVQCLLFYFLPSSVPKAWRKYKRESSAARFLGLVQSLDNGRNCMPSMHMSVATYVSLLLTPVIGPYAYILIVLIGISCVFVKQHMILDLLPGVLLGWLVYVLVI